MASNYPSANLRGAVVGEVRMMTRDELIEMIARMEPTSDADDAIETLNRLICEARAYHVCQDCGGPLQDPTNWHCDDVALITEDGIEFRRKGTQERYEVPWGVLHDAARRCACNERGIHVPRARKRR